eukprot:2690383-Alexandrium_andersonii.AAC.1
MPRPRALKRSTKLLSTACVASSSPSARPAPSQSVVNGGGLPWSSGLPRRRPQRAPWGRTAIC